MLRAAMLCALCRDNDRCPTRPRSAAPHGAMQVTVSGNNVGKLCRSRVPHLTGLDVPPWRPGTTITDGRTDARLRG